MKNAIEDVNAMDPTLSVNYNSEIELFRYLTFFVANKTFGVDLSSVKEIIEHNDITEIPKLPPFIRGAINLRDKVIPVVDLSLRLDYGKTEIGKRTCIIVIEFPLNDEQLKVGMLVDSVHQVTLIRNEQLETAPTFGGNVKTEYISAMAKVNDGFVVILNIHRLLSMEDVKIIQEASESL